MSSPTYIKGKGIRKATAAAVRRWQQLRFDELRHQLASKFSGELRLPIFHSEALPQQQHHPNPTAAPYISINLRTNHFDMIQWLALEHFGFFKSEGKAAAEDAEASRPVVSSEVTLHVGPPKPIGYPKSIEAETQNWVEGVLRGEAYAYNHFYDDSAESRSKQYPSPVRWFSQRLLDGAVSRRVDAHYGVTDQSMLDTRTLAARLFSRPLPPHQLSPYYACDERLGRWGLFGEPGAVLPSALLHRPPGDAAPPLPREAAAGDAEAHLHRVAQLALGSALLPAFRGVWLRGAAVTQRASGATVLLVGPRRSGRTTLALHCLATAPATALTAAEDFVLCPGRYVSAMLGVAPPAGPSFLLASVPGSVAVGVGAVAGSLLPNPALAAQVKPPFLRSTAAVRELLRNTDGVVWGMSQKYRVHLEETFPTPQGARCRPAVLGPIRGVVLLGWDVEELYRPGAVRVNSAVERMPLERAWDHLGRLADDASLVQGHYLLRSVYDDANGFEQLRSIMGEKVCESENKGIDVVRLVGSVNFPLAIKVVNELLNT